MGLISTWEEGKEGEDKEGAKKWGDPVFTAASFIRDKSWKAAQGSAGQGRVKMWCVHLREYYSALKRMEILKHVITLRNHEDTMLSEIHQSQKDTYYLIPLVQDSLDSRRSPIQRDRKYEGGCRGLGGTKA